MPSLAMGVGLDRHDSVTGRELILEYQSDFSTLDGWAVPTAKTYVLVANQSIGGEDAALKIEPDSAQTDANNYIDRFMGADFDQYDTLGYSFDFSMRYYRDGANPFNVNLRMGFRAQSQNNTLLWGTNPSGVTGAWTTVSASGSFSTMTGDYMSFFINSLPVASGQSLWVKDIVLRVYG